MEYACYFTPAGRARIQYSVRSIVFLVNCAYVNLSVLDFLPPYRVIIEIESDTEILVVGVYSVSRSALYIMQDGARLIVSAAASHVFTQPAHPYSRLTRIVKYPKLTVLCNSDYLLTTSARSIRAYLGSVFLEVSPPSLAPAL